MTQLQIQNFALSLFTLDEKAKRPRTSLDHQKPLVEAPVQVPDIVQAPGEEVEVVVVVEEDEEDEEKD
ncbi:unnamed protein product [Brassica oleracea var. botrytis]|uniref:(rape) hypothetical protein n=1 Tax=Brassica napus TaxID=3708 RepID=A0A816S191_BRANA|nr:unnamed protein product [Brassica napus]